MRQHASKLGKIPTGGNVNIKGKELCKYAPHSRKSKPMRSALNPTANMKGKAGSEDGWS